SLHDPTQVLPYPIVVDRGHIADLGPSAILFNGGSLPFWLRRSSLRHQELPRRARLMRYSNCIYYQVQPGEQDRFHVFSGPFRDVAGVGAQPRGIAFVSAALRSRIEGLLVD